MAAQFVVGIWEFQVDNLDEGLVKDMGEYLPYLVDFTAWKQAPQLRTIPVGRSLKAEQPILTYENAESLIYANEIIIVSPCICRKEQKIAGKGCEKPVELCFSFGDISSYHLRKGIGRKVSQTEALDLLKEADKAGLILQPSNSKDIAWLCCCCGCCCGVLRCLRQHPRPSDLVSTPFYAAFEPESCTVCGVCETRCQMDAILCTGDGIVLNDDRCIGCGLCVSTCPSGALALVRKPAARQPSIPKNVNSAMLKLAWKRRKLTPMNLTKLVLKSQLDRVRAGR